MAAKRTPFGTYGGKFVNKSAADLSEVSVKAALASANLDPKTVDSVVFGNVLVVYINPDYLRREPILSFRAHPPMALFCRGMCCSVPVFQLIVPRWESTDCVDLVFSPLSMPHRLVNPSRVTQQVKAF